MGQARRRGFLISAGALLAGTAIPPWIALAQERRVRIGYLAVRQRSITLPPVLKRLGELGYVQGKNLVLEYRSADGVLERLPSLARELIEAKCDLIFAVGPVEAARALIDLKAPVPIVIIALNYDPVRMGIVANLRRPGGNVTGLALLALELSAKHVEILREMLPRAKRFLVFSDAFSKELLESARQAGELLRVEIIPIEFATPPYEFVAAFERGRKARVEALLVLGSPVFLDQRATIYELALKHRMPVAVGNSAMWTGTGWLFGYSVKAEKTYARAGDIAASILKGKNAGDIPIEQPTEYEFGLNLRTAKALGIKIPQSIALRADRVIE